MTGPSPGGIGAASVEALARGQPAALLLLGRTPAKYQSVVDAIRAIDPKIVVRVYGVDLSSLASVRAGAKDILADNERIDVIINSAGALLGGPKSRSVDGYEMTFASNHLGHFLLTNLLMPALRKSAEPRVVNVSSLGHMLAPEGSSSL